MKRHGVIYPVRLSFIIALAICLNGSYGQSLQISGGCTWQAGVSKSKITPEGELWMAGYAFRNRPTRDVRHDLWAKALALRDCEGNLGVMVSLDVVGLPKYILDKVYDKVLRRYDISRGQLMINSSHTHSGPFLYDPFRPQYNEALVGDLLEDAIEYAEILADIISETIGTAIGSLQPARLYSGQGMVNFQVNRRNNTESKIRTLTELRGPNDYSVPVLKVENKEGEIKALLFSYACHATVLSDYQWSGDYPGVAQMELEKSFPGAVALFFQGCGADQNPIPRGSPVLAEKYGRMLAVAVEYTLPEDMEELEPGLYFDYNEVDLKLQTPPDKKQLEAELAEGPMFKKFWARHLLDQLESEGKLIESYPYPIQLWKLGNQTIVGLAGEVVIDYAIQIKRMLGQNTFVFGYCSEGNLSYMPSARIILEGGYEGLTAQYYKGFPSAWSPEIEITILQKVMEMDQYSDEIKVRK